MSDNGSIEPSILGRLKMVAVGTVFVIGASPGCAAGQDDGRSIDQFRLERPPTLHEELPPELVEISGLALSDDGRLFAHGDERAFVYEIDPRSGQALLRFRLGRNGLRGDFEGIAIAGDRFFLVESDGSLIEFGIGEADEQVEYRRIRTRFRNRCEVEGLAFDATTNALLMVCKTPRRRSLEDHLVVFAFSLEEMALEEEERVRVPIGQFGEPAAGGDRVIEPSGIEINPLTGRWFIVASAQGIVLELTREGRPIGSRELSPDFHRQPEGITFGPEGELFIGDEGDGEAATISKYVLPSPTARQ